MTGIAFIGAGSTVFMKNLIGDALQMRALSDARISLMDIDQKRPEESALVARRMIASQGVAARVETHMDQRRALEGADFVIVAFQIGGIMRGLRTVPNRGYIPQLPPGVAVEVPVPVDANGLQPTCVNDIPPQLIAPMRTNVNVQELTVAALVQENRDHIYHAAMLDPHTAAKLDLRQIRRLADDLIAANGDWMPAWLRPRRAG